MRDIDTNEEERQCSTCDKAPLAEGFVIDNGEEYFCNEHEPTYYRTVHQAAPDDNYWTQWEGN